MGSDERELLFYLSEDVQGAEDSPRMSGVGREGGGDNERANERG